MLQAMYKYIWVAWKVRGSHNEIFIPTDISNIHMPLVKHKEFYIAGVRLILKSSRYLFFHVTQLFFKLFCRLKCVYKLSSRAFFHLRTYYLRFSTLTQHVYSKFYPLSCLKDPLKNFHSNLTPSLVIGYKFTAHIF